MALYLTEEDVGRHLTMEGCIEAVEQAFRQWALGQADGGGAGADVEDFEAHVAVEGDDLGEHLL